MVSVEIETKGLKQLIAAYLIAPEKTRQELRRGMGEATALVQRGARSSHRFMAQSGNLERSVSTDISSDGLKGEIFVDRGQAIYGRRIHEGWGTWQPDRFIDQSMERNDAEIHQILFNAISRANARVFGN